MRPMDGEAGTAARRSADGLRREQTDLRREVDDLRGQVDELREELADRDADFRALLDDLRSVPAGATGPSPHRLEYRHLVQRVRELVRGSVPRGASVLVVSKGDEELLERCAVILRLAEHLERGRDQSVSDVRLRPNGHGVDLHLRAPRQRGDADRGARRIRLLEVRRHHLVHLGEIREVREIDRDPHHAGRQPRFAHAARRDRPRERRPGARPGHLRGCADQRERRCSNGECFLPF